MSRPILALLTDFGLRDPYVGAMKGAALSVCPELSIIDISHEVTPHAVAEAAFVLAASYRYFPAGTIFLAVVDPGVGSARRGLAVDAGDYRFVAPDNGILSTIFRDHPPRRVVELSERRFFRPTVSRTFEGRDRFAPAAAWLARGVEVAALGRPVASPCVLELPSATEDGETLTGAVLHADRFGNVITSIDRRNFERFVQDRPFSLDVGGSTIGRLVGTYADIGAEEVCALFGSTDLLELATRSASACERLRVGGGEPVLVRRAPR
jgi:S-adenosylmethionine hydrolase